MIGTNEQSSTVPEPSSPKDVLRDAAVGVSRFVAGIFAGARDGVARAIIRAGIPVNLVTLCGPVVVSVIFLPLALGQQRLAGVVLIAAGAFDMLDGAVARISGRTTRFGGFLDSVSDRYTDFLMLFAILVYLNRLVEGPGRTLYLVLWALTLTGTATTSYVRARAEKEIDECKVGFMERAERSITIILGLLAGNVHVALWILAVMTNLISVQRVLYARMIMSGAEPKGMFWLWRYPRLTAPHFTLSVTFIVLLLVGHWIVPRP